MGLLTTTVVAAIVASVGVTMIGLAVIGCLVDRSRRKADARLDSIQAKVLQLAVSLSDQTRAEGHEARIRLIRAAHATLDEQEHRSTRRQSRYRS